MAHGKESVSSGGLLEILCCELVAVDVVCKKLSVFLKKRQVWDGLSSENIVHLEKLKRGLCLSGCGQKSLAYM